MTPEQFKNLVISQIPSPALRPALLFAMQAAAYEELRRLDAPEAEVVRGALDRLRREAEDAGAKAMGLATIQAGTPALIDQMLGMLD